MNGRELWEKGLIDTRTAIQVALINEGWELNEAYDLIERFVAANIPEKAKRQPYRAWSEDDLTRLDEVIIMAGGKLPKVGVTRPLATELGRSHKSVISQIERRRKGMVGA